MSTEVRWRRGTTAQHSTFTGALGEITVDTTLKTLRVHDGVTAGGNAIGGDRYVLPAAGAVSRTITSRFNEAVSVKDFGAVGDGVTDDTAAFTAALAYAMVVHVPYTSSGYKVSTIALAPNKSLIGDKRVFLKSTAANLIQIQGGPPSIHNHTVVDDFTFDMTGSPAGSSAILMQTGANTIYGVRFSRLHFTNCVTAIQDETSVGNFVVDMMVNDCICTFTRGRQVFIRRNRGFITFMDFKIDHTFNTTEVTWEGARFEDILGLELTKFDVVGPTQPTPAYQPAVTGLVISGNTSGGYASVWLNRVLVDNTRGAGVLLNNLFNLFSNDLCVYQNLGQPLAVTNVTKSVFNNTVVVGGKGLTAAPTSTNGFVLTGCANVQINNTYVDSNKGTGVLVNNSTDCTFNNLQSLNNDSFGVFELGTTNRILLNNLTTSGNTNGNLEQVGAASAAINWYKAGVFTPSTIGAHSS